MLVIVYKEYVVKYCLRGEVFFWKWKVNFFRVVKGYYRFRKYLGNNIDFIFDNVFEVEIWIKREGNRVNSEMSKLSINIYD